MTKKISYEGMIRNKPLSEFVSVEGQELSVLCPVCHEFFITKVNHKGVAKCVVCGNYVDL
jgi:hypothetical protein